MFSGRYKTRQLNCSDHINTDYFAIQSHPTHSFSRRLILWMPLALCLVFSSNLALADDAYDSLINVTAEPPFSETVPQARGVLKASEEAIISSGMSGRLIKSAYKVGQNFKRGDLLAQFDCTQEKAELAALSQAHETLSLRFKNQDQLFQAGAAGQLDVSMANSEMQQAAAERDALKARLKKCYVYAPYAGIVADKHIATYETPALNAPLYTIHRQAAPDISIIIPSKWLRHVEKNTKFQFKVDETGEVLTGRVARIGAAVDPVSQTIEITGKITSSSKRALSGMSGIAVFESQTGL